MKRRLFEDLVVSKPAAVGPRTRSVAVPVSVGLHAVAAAVLVALPVLTSEALPKAIAPPLAPPIFTVSPPPAGGGRLQGRRSSPTPPRPRPSQTTVQLNPDVTPVTTREDVLDPVGPVGPVGASSTPCTGDCRGVGEPDAEGPGIGDGPPTASAVTFVRPGGEIQPPTKVRNVNPVYPDLAKRAGVSGVVIVECVIDTEGRVADARVLKGHPLLDAAAVSAVQQWQYTPTRLNGSPVAVIMTVTVRFELRR